jgi:hypothetical protein
MKAMTILCIIADAALAVLLIAVSGFMLQGVNNTGPAPFAALYVGMILWCIAAPIIGWIVRGRQPAALLISASPLIIALIATMTGPG